MPPGRDVSKQAPDAKTSPHSVAYPSREVAGPKQPSHLAPFSAEPPARPSFGIRVSAALKIRLLLIRVPSSGRRAERLLGVASADRASIPMRATVAQVLMREAA